MRRGTIDAPTIEELQCLNSWPEETRGHSEDTILLYQVKELCDKHGYGRMHQLLEQIYEIWRNPESAGKFNRLNKERFKMMGIEP